MPRFVEQEVRQRGRDPSDSGSVELLIGHSGDITTVEELVEEVGGEVLETLPFSTLTASIPETAIERVVDSPAIETIELDSGMETLQGN